MNTYKQHQFKHIGNLYFDNCTIINELIENATPSWPFPNDREDLSHLRMLLGFPDSNKKLGVGDPCRSCRYRKNLTLYLESNGFTLMEFNLLLIRRSVCSKSLKKVKPNSIAVLSIAHYMMTAEGTSPISHFIFE